MKDMKTMKGNSDSGAGAREKTKKISHTESQPPAHRAYTPVGGHRKKR